MNTAIVQSCLVRSNSIEVWGMIFPGRFTWCLKYFQLFWKMFSNHFSVTFTLFISMWLIAASSFAIVSNIPSDSTCTQSRTDTPHGLLFGVMDDQGVKTCIDMFNHCVPHIKHCIISCFQKYVKLINRIINFPGNPRIRKFFPGNL